MDEENEWKRISKTLCIAAGIYAALFTVLIGFAKAFELLATVMIGPRP